MGCHTNAQAITVAMAGVYMPKAISSFTVETVALDICMEYLAIFIDSCQQTRAFFQNLLGVVDSHLDVRVTAILVVM